jgi:hypothetical protein
VTDKADEAKAGEVDKAVATNDTANEAIVLDEAVDANESDKAIAADETH